MKSMAVTYSLENRSGSLEKKKRLEDWKQKIQGYENICVMSTAMHHV